MTYIAQLNKMLTNEELLVFFENWLFLMDRAISRGEFSAEAVGHYVYEKEEQLQSAVERGKISLSDAHHIRERLVGLELSV